MKKCQYDYEKKCTCAEDDNCGCDYSNNMKHPIRCEVKLPNSPDSLQEKLP